MPTSDALETSRLAEQHAAEIRSGERFAFGENWRRFLNRLDDDRIAEAERSLTEMLGSLAGARMLDAGSGSGLFSLAARRLGAERVHSFDFDPASVACTAELRRRYCNDDSAWTVEQGSVLDADYLQSLGTWDLVYSWGVLHHTGDMWTALDLIESAVAPSGRLFIAIYNDEGGRSQVWLRLKRIYNALPRPLRVPYAIAVLSPLEILALVKDVRDRQPGRYVRLWTQYKSARGMSRWRDMIDWIGGLPYEVATPAQITAFYGARGFELEASVRRDGLGCNEFVFRRSA